MVDLLNLIWCSTSSCFSIQSKLEKFEDFTEIYYYFWNSDNTFPTKNKGTKLRVCLVELWLLKN